LRRVLDSSGALSAAVPQVPSSLLRPNLCTVVWDVQMPVGASPVAGSLHTTLAGWLLVFPSSCLSCAEASL